jgi:integrase
MSQLPVTRGRVRLTDEEFVKDKTYQETPIGKQVKRWLQALQYEDAPQTTRDSYEIIGARLAVEFAHLDGLHELTERGGDGVGKLRFFLDKHWGDSAPATRRQRRSGLSSLFEWALDEEFVEWNPVSRIKPPRGKGRRRSAHPQDTIVQLIYRQDSMRDRVCCGLIGRLGLRKDAIRRMQARDIRCDTGELGFRLKGGGWAELPYSAFRSLALELDFFLQAEEFKPREYILHPRGDRSRPMHPATVHRWFKRCLDRAGLPDMEMHELRHSAGDFTRRATDYLVAKNLLVHQSVKTTEIYLHPDMDELRANLEIVEAVWQKRIQDLGMQEVVRYANPDEA